jgi:hypothetical protein
MGSLLFLFYPWGMILQVVALVHFARRRPDTYWLWIIFIGGGVGALAYLLIEAAPDLTLLGGTVRGFSRRKRIRELQFVVMDNPSPGNFEELGDLYFEEKKYAQALECFDKAISSRTDHADPFYRRALCAMESGDYAAALPDLEQVMAFDRRYDYQRAVGLLAHCCAKLGQVETASALFVEATATSTLSETQCNYAAFLASQGRTAEARELARQVLNKKATLPNYLKRRERPWFRRAQSLLKQIPAQ